jgi:SAM-dependent methyltransferase
LKQQYHSTSGVEKSWESAVQWLRTQPDQRDLVIDAYYDDPLQAAAERYWASEEWRAIVAFLPRCGNRALDVGAGRGIASYALAREGFTVSALEPNASALVGAEAIRSLVRDTGLPIQVVEDFSERLPFDDQSFDLVFARAVLHHAHDLAAACREFHRVLKRGGRLIAVREHVISRADDLPRFFELHPLHKLYGGENAHLLSRYLSVIEAAGFRSVVTLAPFDSPINFAPLDMDRLRGELARRIEARVPGSASVVERLLARPTVWGLARRLLNFVDSRPGRLYSFVADRP